MHESKALVEDQVSFIGETIWRSPWRLKRTLSACRRSEYSQRGKPSCRDRRSWAFTSSSLYYVTSVFDSFLSFTKESSIESFVLIDKTWTDWCSFVQPAVDIFKNIDSMDILTLIHNLLTFLSYRSTVLCVFWCVFRGLSSCYLLLLRRKCHQWNVKISIGVRVRSSSSSR